MGGGGLGRWTLLAIGNTSTYFFARILLTGREIEIYLEDEFHSANNSRTRLLLKLVSYEKMRKKIHLSFSDILGNWLHSIVK